MSPRRRREDEPDEDEEEGDLSAIIRFVPDPPLSPEVVDAFARKKQREASVKAANKMYQPILESYREYAKTLQFIPWVDR
jgi:hypothetical protein